MPYGNMTLEELARHIGMDTREVKRFADRGTLPGHMIGGRWRFNRAQLLDWLQSEMHTLDATHIRNLERAMSDGSAGALVSGLLVDEAVDMNLAAKSKASVLRELVGLAERAGLVYDRPGVVAALETREALCSTALPGGIALPHPRRPLEYEIAEPLICLARVPAGIPFGAPDGRLTDLFFLVCCKDERRHLCVLARLALMFSAGLADALRETDEPEEALALVLRTEDKVMTER